MYEKNDIRSIHFDKLFEDYRSTCERLEEERLEVHRSFVAASNKRRMDEYVKEAQIYADPEAGSDGIEESIYEAANFTDPKDVELTADMKSKCEAEARRISVDGFIDTQDIGLKYKWLLPQMIAYFGRWTAFRNDSGKIDPRLTVVNNLKTNMDRGIWLVAQTPLRSSLIKDNSTRLYKEGSFNSLVPLILNGFKLYQNIKYSSWSRDKLHWVVHEPLADAMKLTEMPTLSNEEILELRKEGLTAKTGKSKGTMSDPKTAYKLFNLAESKIANKYDLVDTPMYALIMLSQIWCAHPSNRTPNMVLDPINWDNMPDNVIETDVFKSEIRPTRSIHTRKIKEVAAEDLPWET